MSATRGVMPDYYAILQVDRRADPEVIEVAYRRLARKWHPDHNRGPGAATRMKRLNEAYGILGDPARRQAYDATLLAGAKRGGRGRVRPRPVAPLLVTVLGILGALIGIRLLGVLARVPLLLALLGAVVYGALRSIRR